MTDDNYNIDDIVIQKIVVDDDNHLNGVSIKESGIKKLTDGLVVGIEHNNERFLNPGSDVIFQTNDIIWIVGERNKLQRLIK